MPKLYSIKKWMFLCALPVLFSCSNDSSTTSNADRTSEQAVNETVSSTSSFDLTYKFEDEAKRYSFPSANPKEINLPSGTNIKIPGNCFVDAEGNKIKGEVDVVFEEFLSAGSIISSQINMKYDSAGTLGNFESAGMFKINAFQNEREVYIAKDKSIEIELATTDNDRDFNSYYSTHNGDDWQYLDRSKAISNDNRDEAVLRSQLELKSASKPSKPVSYSANGKYFDLNLSHTHTHDLKSLLGIVWEYAGNDKKNDPVANKVDFNKKWDFVNIVPSEGDKRGVYEITLQNNDTTIKTIARPVYRGAVLDAENELFTKELGEFNNRMAQLKNEMKQALAESSFLRTMSIKKLGLYNYDRQYHSPDMVPIYANFNFGADSLKKYPITVFLITGNGMAVIKYPPGDWDKFMYSRKDVNKMIAILPDQEICTFSAKRFEKEAPVFPENSPGKFVFKLNHTGVKATNSKSIDQVLNNI